MMRGLLLLVLMAAPLAVRADDAPVVPAFAEETATAGIEHSYAGEWQYMVGGGVAAFDCDGDGRQDLFLAGGESPARLYHNDSTPGGTLAFSERPSGLELDAVTGAYPLDVDSDGTMDLVLLRVGANSVMRGLGDCRFRASNEEWHFDGGDGWSTALAATWEKGASWPTIAIGNYIDRREEFSPWGSCTDNWLHRPAEGGGFAAPLPLTPSYCPLSMLFTDWNRSGTPSLRVSNDREYYEGGQEQLWHIEPGQPPRLYSAAEGWKALKIWGMGIASYDLKGDGTPDYFLTSMADSKLQELAPGADGAPNYRDLALAAGVTAQRPFTGGDVRPSTGWHAEFEDVNNDGYADLFVAKGNVSEMPDFAIEDPNNLLLQRPDGTFMEAADKAGVASLLTSRGAALADLNLDGLPDLVVVNRNGPAQIWRNLGPGGHWLGLRPHQDGADPDAVGGWIEVRTGDRIQRRELTVGGGHASGEAGWWHFGLGSAAAADVRVLWPDGTAGDWQAVPADGFYRLNEGKPPERWTYAAP
ncbi:MAG: CRTAC1 family protein [Paracoccaceae bacterium]